MAETERRVRAMAQDRLSVLLYRAVLCGCLLGSAATLYFLGGVRGHLGSSLLNVGTAAVTVSAALFSLYLFLVQMWDRGRLGLLIWVSILLVVLSEVVLSLVPPTARDELTHHLAMPRLYVKAGRIVEVPFASYSYYPMLLDMLYVPWVQWGWDSIPKLIHGLFGLLTALLLYAYLARRLSTVYGLLGSFFFIFTPAVLRLSNYAYVDLGLTFYSTASLLCLLRWIESMEARRWLILAGLAAGFALATKPNGLLVFLLLFFLLAFALGREKVGHMGQIFSSLLLFSVFALLPFSPWLVKNISQTGTPLFPFFTGLLGGGVGGEAEPGLGVFVKRELLYGESWWQMAALPLRLFFSGQDDKPQYFDGVLSPLLILFLPWAFKGKWVEEKRLLFSFALLYFLYALFLTDLRVRYILPIVSSLVILLVYGIHNLYLRIVHPSFLFSAVVLLLSLNGIYLWNTFQTVSPREYLKGRESRDAYLTRMLPDYAAFRYINQNLPSRARVYLLYMGRRVYYCERDYFFDDGDNAWVLLRMIQRAQTESDIQLRLRERGLTHLLVREDLLKKFLHDNLTLQQQRMWGSFAARFLQGVFRDRGFSLYQIDG